MADRKHRAEDDWTTEERHLEEDATDPWVSPCHVEPPTRFCQASPRLQPIPLTPAPELLEDWHPIQDEAAALWRPSAARRSSDEAAELRPEDPTWENRPGTTVEYRWRTADETEDSEQVPLPRRRVQNWDVDTGARTMRFPRQRNRPRRRWRAGRRR
jgi:hypothetical protein